MIYIYKAFIGISEADLQSNKTVEQKSDIKSYLPFAKTKMISYVIHAKIRSSDFGSQYCA